MKKSLIITLLYSLFPFFTIAQEFNSSFICSHIWGTDQYSEIQEYYTMEFKKDGSWFLSSHSPGFISYASGEYQLLGKNRIVTITENQFDIPKELSNKNNTWLFSFEYNNINYYYKLSTETGYVLYLLECPPPPGSVREKDGIRIELLRHKEAITSSAAKVRSGSGLEFDAYVFEKEDERFNALPKNTSVIIKGILYNPDNYDLHEWYYCNLYLLYWFTTKPLDGWISSDYLNIIGDDKNAIYY